MWSITTWLVAAVARTAAVQPTSSNYTWTPQMGQHRALVRVSAPISKNAVYTILEWRRRPIPNASATDVVITNAATGDVVHNAVRAPAGPGIDAGEALVILFEPLYTTPPPSPPSPPAPSGTQWIENTGTSASSIVRGCSGAYDVGTACWKAVDGRVLFNSGGGTQEGWDGSPAPSTTVEWLVLTFNSICCMLYAVCCMLYAECCMLYAVCCMLYAVCEECTNESTLDKDV